METLRTGIDWAQGLAPIPKGVISFVLFLLWVLAVTILWQKPDDKADTSSQNASTNIQTGNTTSAGQSGGVTAGLYINQAPPVTAQQKEEALLSLQSELDELSNFPNRPDGQPPRTIFETLAQTPRRLYAILTKYYKPTIGSVPKIGADLLAYKASYYDFENKEYDFENNLITQIGALSKTQFRDAWGLCLRYFIMRTHGLSKEQIMSGGYFLNYGITWDDAERITADLLKAPDVSQNVDVMKALQNSVWEDGNRVMNKYKEHQ